MYKILCGFCLMCLSQFSFGLTIVEHSAIKTNCQAYPMTFYGNDSLHLWDIFNNRSGHAGILSSKSEVSVFIKDHKVTIPNGWVQVSSYFPSDNESYYTVWNNALTTLNISKLVPADRNTPVAQIMYKIRRMYQSDVETSNTFEFNGDYTYAKYVKNELGPFPTSLGNLKLLFSPNTLGQGNEYSDGCALIMPQWCGDGVVDDTHGELCDLADKNGKPGESCSSACKIITP